jgi:hypothetical protein
MRARFRPLARVSEVVRTPTPCDGSDAEQNGFTTENTKDTKRGPSSSALLLTPPPIVSTVILSCGVPLALR